MKGLELEDLLSLFENENAEVIVNGKKWFEESKEDDEYIYKELEADNNDFDFVKSFLEKSEYNEFFE